MKKADKKGAVAKTRSLRRRMLLILLPVVMIALTAVSAMGYQSSYSINNKEINDKMTAKLSGVVNDVEKSLTNHRSVVLSLAKTAETLGGKITKDDFAELVMGAVSINADTCGSGVFYEPYAFDATMKLFGPYAYRQEDTIAFTEDYNLIENDYTASDWYNSGKTVTDGVAWSAPYIDAVTGVSMVTATAPILDTNGKFMGVATGDIDLTNLQQMISGIEVGGSGYAFLTDASGLYIAGADAEKLLTLNIQQESNASMAELGKTVLSNPEGTASFTDDSGAHSVFYARIPDTGWVLAIVMPQNELYQSLNGLLVRLIVILGIAFVVAFALIYLTVLRISRPIQATARCAKALAQGQLDAPLTVKTKDETGLLAATIDVEVRNAFKEIEKAREKANKQSAYQAQQVDKLVVNLERLSRGELYCDMTVSEADEDTREIGALFTKISGNLHDSIDTIKGYIDEISGMLGEMADGNIDVEITAEYRGDFARLKDSINRIAAAFDSVLTDIRSSAEQVASGTTQVSNGSQQISQGATEQAGAIEELSASITQIAAQARENASKATEANELSLLAGNDAQKGNEQMLEMQKAMAEISESSESISKIIRVIDDIAFQTNILALNAAVEAARAGAHGKGFAVVAEEVRNLAGRSATAAKETADLIERSLQKVEAGTRIANQTVEALANIAAGVQSAVEIVGQITAASDEQASAVGQVNRGLEQLSTVVQENSATAQESAAASEELSGQAEMLKTMVEMFTLKSGQAKAGLETARKHEPKGQPTIRLTDNEFGKY